MATLVAVAARNLSRNRRRTALCLLALTLGFAAMLFVRAFMFGEQQAVILNLTEGELGALKVHRRGYFADLQAMPLNKNFVDDEALRTRVLSVGGVTSVAPRILFGGMFTRSENDEDTAFVMLVGIDGARELATFPRRAGWLAEGQLFQGDDGVDLILDQNSATAIRSHPTLPTQVPDSERPAILTGDVDGALNGTSVVHTATLKSALPGDQKTGFLPLKAAQRLLRMEGRVTEYAIAVDSLRSVPRVKEELQRVLGPDFEVHAWDDVAPFVKEMVKVQGGLFNVLTLVFTFIVVLSIVNAMLMNVLERVREIGTMMAVGMRRAQIAALFLLEGGVLGAVGGGLGIVLGGACVFAANRYGLLFKLPGAEVSTLVRPSLEPAFLVQAFVSAVLSASLAALWPAFRASRLQPVEALSSP